VAKSAGIPLFIGNYSSDNLSNSQKEQWEFVRQLQPQLVVLAGFLKKFPLNQETTFDSPQIINIHPSLLPKFGGNGFYGEKVHKAVIDANEAYSGATVHFVDQEYDTGTLISFAKLVINPMETPESLSLRVFELEKNLLPTTISMLLDHQLPLHDKSWELVL
jgi:phosphoribosylglycinamide formyltransferase-1